MADKLVLNCLQRLGAAGIIALAILGGCQKETSKVEPRPADYVLAFSWQPAFCEHRPQKRECKSQTQDRYDASHFSLHGLWPQPRNNTYCGVSGNTVDDDKNGKWMRLNPLTLTSETRRQLEEVMPGHQSGLHRHEWVKHGTCYQSRSAEEYYRDSIWLLRELNKSGLRNLFSGNIGAHLTSQTIRRTLDDEFGKGAGDRVRVKCRLDKNSGRRLIVEMTLALAGNISEARNAGELIIAAVPDLKEGCPGGIVDPVGLQ